VTLPWVFPGKDEILSSNFTGIIIGGRTVNNLRYADDTTILAEEKEEME
jgi:hypothetical protein